MHFGSLRAALWLATGSGSSGGAAVVPLGASLFGLDCGSFNLASLLGRLFVYYMYNELYTLTVRTAI